MRFASLPFLALICSQALLAVEPTADQTEFFERRIRPVLAQDCYECHNSLDKHQGGLSLDHKSAMLKGGESGPAIVPGNAGASLLIQSIRQTHAELKMPKNGAKLDPAVIQDFETWIADGAADPRISPPTKQELASETAWEAIRERRKLWWSFQPIRMPEIPAGDAENPIDRFLDAKLREAKLPPAPKADAATLKRRLSYVVTGLPPNDSEATIDSLLNSPRFGERWARHWMDWLRYAESSGSEGDPPIPNAYRYRNYLIRALNADIPVDQLVKEHLAGDLLASPRLNRDLKINESAIGTAHLRMCYHGFAPTDALEEQVRYTDDQIDVISKAFLGLTVSCARCHNHKFDAISQADYYALYGVFATTRPAQINVDVEEKQQTNRQKLTGLKHTIRAELATAWSANHTLPNLDAAAWQKLQKEIETSKARLGQRPTLNGWHAHGNGLNAEPTRAGEFRIADEGDAIITQILPAGYYSNLLSTKHAATLQSPKFQLKDDQEILVRVAGQGEPIARYVVHNYPRDGTVFPYSKLADPHFKWIRWDMTYWKGDSIYLELTNANDGASLTKAGLNRSWFGITDAIVQSKNLPQPADEIAERLSPLNLQAATAQEAYQQAIEASLSAWRNNSATNEQARFLDDCVQTGILPNSSQTLPSIANLVKQYRALEAEIDYPTRTPGVFDGEPLNQALMVRGDHKQLGEIISKRFLEAFDATPFSDKQSGRLQLANAILADKDPLIARVIVNRLWHHVFGKGLVATPDNFGRLGKTPSHPELLDYLAMRFKNEGWSVKKMLRLMLGSKAFQRSSEPSETASREDAENSLLSHFTVQRLDAEAIRDTMLSIAGTLDFTTETPSVDGSSQRRSVYVKVIRNTLDPFLSTFDAPAPNSTKGNRDITNVPAQSLTLMNSPFILQTAKSLVQATRETTEPQDRISRLYQKVLGRPPKNFEITTCLDYLKQSEAERNETTKAQDSLRGEISKVRAELVQQMEPRQKEFLSQNESYQSGAIAEWNFSKPVAGLTFHNGAKVESGALVLDGKKAYASSAPLPQPLAAKTLEAWVQLDTLSQSGGGVLTVQSLDGNVFDSLVYAERQPLQWMAGSDFGRRSKSFAGPAENEAINSPVHLAITYEDGGKISAYRNGIAYGSEYSIENPVTFAVGQSQLLLGLRHGAPVGDRLLKGRIYLARLYDRALSPAEVAQSASRLVRMDENAVIQSLGAEALALQSKLRELQQQLDGLPAPGDPWQELAHSLLNTKELIYLR